MPSATINLPLPGRRAAWLAGGLTAGLLLAAMANPAFAPRPALATVDPSAAPEHTLSVSGTGKVVVSPDIADLRLGVSVTKPTVKDARAAAASAMTAVLAALRQAGIQDADLKTTILSLRPVYEYPSGGAAPHLTGYNLSNSVAATIRNLDDVAAAVDGALAAGATSMDGITFSVADPAKAEEQARQAAIVQARSKAGTLAAAAGVAIDGVASISETSAGTPYPVAYTGAAPAAKDVATPVEAGTNEVTVTVSVVFLIR